ncbi:MAG TPA: phenylalanine--tRNA ligase subunit alpha [Candidatus Omnitrophota bacterium]|nr:phenylalanine--tRNA ligase subunit alpha [Candidatus Omnitrophota bacterium]
MIEALRKLEAEAQTELSSLSDLKSLEALKVKYLGRKGLFASISSRISEVPKEERGAAGQELNRVKQILEELFTAQERKAQSTGPAAARIDTTMPGTFPAAGGLHPLTLVIQEVSLIFERLGFTVEDGPEAEDERHNFEALNIPLNHPARDGFDTFYLENGKLLRSQTSTVQIRVMERTKPPLKIIAPGKVYRPDATDATHSFMFHQIEGLMVDEGVSFAHLKGVLYEFAKQFFGPNTKLQFRPHFFPFTEPSAEIDIWWEGKGWLEILGAGMVHPNVLKAVKIDPEKYTGFAFGMGVERMAMLKYGVSDIRDFFHNDLRFLKQFR